MLGVISARPSTLTETGLALGVSRAAMMTAFVLCPTFRRRLVFVAAMLVALAHAFGAEAVFCEARKPDAILH